MDRRSFLAASAAFMSACLQDDAWAQQPGWRHPDLDHMLTLLRTQRWSELCALVAGLPPQRAASLLHDIGEEAPMQIEFGDIASRPMGDTIAAAIQVGWAWRFRGHGVASTVTATGLAGFEDNLNLAKAHIENALVRDPNDGVARSLGFTVSTGLNDLRALNDGLRPFLLSTRRPVSGFSAFANAISGKWLGSEEQTLEFARQTYLLDLPASAALIVDVHSNCWGARAMVSGSAAGDFPSYISQADVRREIIAANVSYNSVGPDPDQFANWYANAWFSFALMALNEPVLAGPHFRNMGDYIGGPWKDVPDAPRTIGAIRHALGIEAL